MSDMKLLLDNLEMAVKELRLALEASESSEQITNQKTNEELFTELNIRL